MVRSGRRELVARGLVGIADEEQPAVEAEVVPGRAAQDLHGSELLEGLGIELDERQISLFGQYEQQIADAQDLSVLEAATFPLPFAAFDLNALEDALGEAIDMAAMNDHVCELRLQHARILPFDFGRQRAVGIGINLEQLRSAAIALAY